MMNQAQRNLHQKKNYKAGKASRATTFSSHVNELRARALWTALVFMLASGLAYAYQQDLLHIIMRPLKGQELIYLTPGGGFNLIFQIAIYAGLIACLPMLFYQLYAFVRPALPLNARRSAAKIITAVICLISLGVIYGYFVAIPVALEFLNNFAGDAVTPSLTADSYLNFFLAYIAGLSVLSLLPLLLLFCHWIHPLTPSGLLKSERWVIVGAFIVAAIITPTPDIVNQVMIAGPVIGIYQLGVIGVLISLHRKKAREKKNTPSLRHSKRTSYPLRHPSGAPSTKQSSIPIPVPAVPQRMRNHGQSIDGFRRNTASNKTSVHMVKS